MSEGPCAVSYLHDDDVLRALPSLVDDESAMRLAETFKALSDPTRVRIVSLLADAELCVCDLAAALDMSQSAISHQLRTLREMQLVRRRREGRQAFYTLDDDHVANLFRRGLEHVGHG
ncbi:MAG: metalloregulator ArsR/SmtB family transcription factor [Anaerolineae bacterium]|nr:metalloregulator ArsR/SmtB family transcription factor [Anaerolineae bacterium]